MKSDKTLSILIDESGDFGKFDSKDPNYHVVMVIHEQQDDITDRVKTFNRTLSDRGYANHYIHVGPLIRREKPYLEFERQERRSLFNFLFHFTRQAPIRYIGVTMDKRKLNDQSPVAYTDALTKMIVSELKQHYEELIPHMCALDHAYAKILHAKLIRTHTVAGGADSCDYWYVPDKSSTAKSILCSKAKLPL